MESQKKNINIDDEDINDLILDNIEDVTDLSSYLNEVFNIKSKDNLSDINGESEEEEESEEESEYVYVVKLSDDQKLYYLKPEQTHYFLDNVKCKVNYIKVSINSIEYYSSFYNTKINTDIKDKEPPQIFNQKWLNV